MRTSPLQVDLTTQPALEVDFYMLDGDIILLGTVGCLQIELRDTVSGDHFNPQGSILVQVFPVAANAPATDPVVTGIAQQVELEGEPARGQYVFYFDSTPLIAETEQPTQAMARVTIPFQPGSVVSQKTFQLKAQNDLS